MDIWHKYAAVAYLAVFMDVTGHAYPTLPLPRLKGGGIFDKGEGVKNGISYTIELGLTSLGEDTANRKFGHRKPLPEHSRRS